MPALLEARSLHAGYGETRVLHGIDFAVEQAGVTALLGANGAGKTTTLRAICGMVRTSGEIRLGEERIDGRATEDIVQRGVAHVPDGRGTFFELTVEENLRLGAYIRRDRHRIAQDFERVFGYFPRLRERFRREYRAHSARNGRRRSKGVPRGGFRSSAGRNTAPSRERRAPVRCERSTDRSRTGWPTSECRRSKREPPRGASRGDERRGSLFAS